MLRVITGSILYMGYDRNERAVEILYPKTPTAIKLLTTGFYLVPEATEELSL
jgi:hypothetical protein